MPTAAHHVVRQETAFSAPPLPSTALAGRGIWVTVEENAVGALVMTTGSGIFEGVVSTPTVTQVVARGQTVWARRSGVFPLEREADHGDDGVAEATVGKTERPTARRKTGTDLRRDTRAMPANLLRGTLEEMKTL